MIQTAAWLPPEPVGAWKVPAANGMSIDSITLSDGRSRENARRADMGRQ